MIIFNATSRRATCQSDDAITIGSVGIGVRFSCSSEWAGLTRVAVFRGSGEQTEVLLASDDCTVPAKVLVKSGGDLIIGRTVPAKVLVKSGGDLIIGLYGTDGSGALAIPTVWADAGRILPGAVLPDIDPTPEEQSLLDQLIEALQRDASDAAASAEAAGEAADDAKNQAKLSQSWAVGGTGARADEEQNNSKFWAQVAQQGAEENGFAWFDIDDQTGEMSVTITPNLDRDLKFQIDENTGELEVKVYG